MLGGGKKRGFFFLILGGEKEREKTTREGGRGEICNNKYGENLSTKKPPIKRKQPNAKREKKGHGRSCLRKGIRGGPYFQGEGENRGKVNSSYVGR